MPRNEEAKNLEPYGRGARLVAFFNFTSKRSVSDFIISQSFLFLIS
uniref:Uncharacterized protein n=1 Tax=Rhizophora mucronata TaxID=61149 RepID=A0A2P2KEM1_RHIMU